MPDALDHLTRHLVAEAESFGETFQAIDSAEDYEGQDPVEALYEAPLELTTKTLLTVVLATGGPHVEVTAIIDSDGQLEQTAIVGWWGRHKVSEDIRPDSPLFRALGYYAEMIAVLA